MLLLKAFFVDQKLTVAYPNRGGIAAGVFLKARGWDFQKFRCCVWVPCQSTPIFTPNPNIRAIVTNRPII